MTSDIIIGATLGGGFIVALVSILVVWRLRKSNLGAAKQVQIQSQDTMKEFIEESKLLTSIRPYENVIQFLGMCNNPLMIITRFNENGSLLKYLKSSMELPHGMLIKLLKELQLVKETFCS